ncbi:putative odorant receptor 65b [Nymphalis io]|uniref:putative odorant receptor 65b n=1 Tax=Inachis io TaxID=171585 RepID=UPI00216838C7|nr:putative odorant receptor 65b [Nymphalis io]
MARWPLIFEDVYKISTRSMRLNCSHPFIADRNKFWLIKVVFLRVIALVCFIFLLNSIICHDVKAKKYTEAIKNGIMAIVAMTVTFKHGILVHRHRSIKDLIKLIDRDYKLAEDLSSEERNIVLYYVEKGVQICRFWLVAAGLTSLMFPIKALVLMAQHCLKDECALIPMFDFTYPKVINEYKDILSVYCATFLLCISFDLYSMSVYIGFDPLVPIFMLHTCGQLDLVSRNLSKALKEASTTQEKKENLKRINLKLVEIYRFVKNVQKIFVILYEFNMKTTTFLIPFSAFQIVESLRNKEITIEFISFFFGAILHFYVPCYYSNLLMVKSESLRQAIYACGWEMESDIQIRKTILLMLTRTSAPLVIKTVFYPICLDTFAEMARQAYGIYNIMNAAWV